MQKRTLSAINPSVFTLPNLEFRADNLDQFLSKINLPVGIPLFQINVQILFCRDLAGNLYSVIGEHDIDIVPHNRVMDIVRLLKNRLIVLEKVFEHGRSCCKVGMSYTRDHYDRIAFQVEDLYDSIESAMNREFPQTSLPLQAICNSIASCIGVCECLYDCGGGERYKKDESGFAGRGKEGALHSLMLIEEQLDLVEKAIVRAQEHSFFVDTNSEVK